ncbi:NADH dehydrogenase [ubiquinone] 1 beta subcomplex subunit 3-B [Pyrus x bretschneideri]|uniref:NADH dehydrogenase [ubiquinone] 1 beta subcomplex subunit 3-B n=1 Tax=Pyrus x bretschneideri TaxID=225117 RepID=UPI00202F1E13|nr:NADH dehydrogenase [ubiquinone] 1 beta subcomplex subunit 3-B [Pyrus x bretschneideri]XP_009341230.2 NADH dehydrogenase [ubiquinone] 1 beta subcomplex subunit 3-B [Pyrus x bretschneideri]
MGAGKKALGTTGEFFRRRDEWRKHPMLSNQLRHATPGLGIALVAFGVYLVGEQVYDRLIAPSHSSSSSSSHHAHSHSVTSTAATH